MFISREGLFTIYLINMSSRGANSSINSKLTNSNLVKLILIKFRSVVDHNDVALTSGTLLTDSERNSGYVYLTGGGCSKQV